MSQAEAILRQAEEERRNYLAYMDQVGLNKESNPALVDSNGRGSSQWGLGTLLNRKLSGYYFFSGDRFLQLLDSVGSVNAYIKNLAFTESPDMPPLYEYIFHAEILMGHSEASLRHFTRDDNGTVAPVFCDMFLQSDENAARIDFAREVQTGALAFVRGFAERLGRDVRYAHIDPEFSLAVFHSMIGVSVPEDAALWLDQYGESVFNGMRPLPLAYVNLCNKARLTRRLWGAPSPLNVSAGNFSVALEHWHEGPFDPSLKKPLPAWPALKLPEVISSPEEYAVVGNVLLSTTHKHMEHVLGRETYAAFRQKSGHEDSPAFLASLYTKIVTERHHEQLQKKAEALAGKPVYYFGCGAAYEYYKGLFQRCLPQCMLLTMPIPGGTPASVDGLPIRHPRDVLGKGERLPMILFVKLEYSGSMLDGLAREYPEYEGDLIVPCVLLPGTI
jgi:hypothetical protein